ncbi:hypothetical protein NQ314_005789 [Rhamnusium bicolor]|uniref:Uncharacterized protein n=1 Tax=Rhamnusium bicolor TaxID=1586634 RepID=A0AAV8ZCF6_9CUCU|nr:hypothetical protein NQ314_005789 [Rhamnusium bicolor]
MDNVVTSQSIDCSDGMIHMGGLEAQNCDNVFEAQYCIKSTSLDGMVFWWRIFCRTLDLHCSIVIYICRYRVEIGTLLRFLTIGLISNG